MPPSLTLSFRFSSQLQRELRDTLKGSQMGLRLFLTNCEAQAHGPKGSLGGGGLEGVPNKCLSPLLLKSPWLI